MTAVLLPGWVNAESPDFVTLLSLTKPQNGVLSSGNSSLTWRSEGTTGTSLDNFAISFQLTETRNTSSPQNIVYSPMQVRVLIWRRQLKEAVFFSRWLCGKAGMEDLPQLPCTVELKPWEQFLLISPPVQALWNGINPVSGRTRRRRHSLTLSWRRLIPKPRIQTFSTLLACRFRNRLRHPWVCWGWRPWWFAAAGKPENLVLPAVKGVFACKVQPCRRFF